MAWHMGIQRVTRGQTRARTRPCDPILNVHTVCDTGVFLAM
ncbi:hypothetical protein F383_07663 [Gossypium arboreum]|uniref:Uncharacterized protein n=1 Tax=Gossypium arboreum TaxID=29729 RepID=A0A0B0P6Q8_GOSAR|nr:hypothetical protein F383_15412 [Gossypium arboreum]KHG22398.1 hypothetical protein F383_07663 [Gossypium arboreum]